jgi:hypothetical protein
MELPSGRCLGGFVLYDGSEHFTVKETKVLNPISNRLGEDFLVEAKGAIPILSHHTPKGRSSYWKTVFNLSVHDFIRDFLLESLLISQLFRNFGYWQDPPTFHFFFKTHLIVKRLS